jgi:predicted nucleic acid-binding protein
MLSFQSGSIRAFSSVITLAEVLPKPLQAGQEHLAAEFTEFLRRGRNFTLVEISAAIAEKAGRLRGKYPMLKALDALQLATALELHVDAFLTNDMKLKRVEEVNIWVLKGYW